MTDKGLEFTTLEDDVERDDYPPKGTPEMALVVSVGEDNYAVVHHTGRYFHAQVVDAGFNGEEVGIDAVPDEPGAWVFENGKPWTGRDWETNIVDDGGISGDWRRATPGDFKAAGLPCPLDLSATDAVALGRELAELIGATGLYLGELRSASSGDLPRLDRAYRRALRSEVFAEYMHLLPAPVICPRCKGETPPQEAE